MERQRSAHGPDGCATYGAGSATGSGLGRFLAGWRFAVVLTSPLQCAAEACRLAGLGEGAGVREDLGEWDYGEYEGRTTSDIRRGRPGWTLWTGGVPGGETAGEVARRADRIIGEVRGASGDVALFAHTRAPGVGGPLDRFLHSGGGASPSARPRR